MEQENASLRCAFDICYHSLKVQSDSVLVVVSVFLDSQTRVFEDSRMIGP